MLQVARHPAHDAPIPSILLYREFAQRRLLTKRMETSYVCDAIVPQVTTVLTHL